MYNAVILAYKEDKCLVAVQEYSMKIMWVTFDKLLEFNLLNGCVDKNGGIVWVVGVDNLNLLDCCDARFVCYQGDSAVLYFYQQGECRKCPKKTFIHLTKELDNRRVFAKLKQNDEILRVFLGKSDKDFKDYKDLISKAQKLVYVYDKEIPNVLGGIALSDADTSRKTAVLSVRIREHMRSFTPVFTCIDCVATPLDKNMLFVLGIPEKAYKNLTGMFINANIAREIIVQKLNDYYEDWADNEKITDFVDDAMTILHGE